MPGKIDASLNERLAGVQWGEYRLGDLFEVNSYKKRFDSNKAVILESGHPYVVRMSKNNGIKGYLNEDKKYLNNGNTISFGQDTATMFYQEKPYFTGDKIKILESKYHEFNKKNAQFLISAMSKAFSSFSWGTSSFSAKTIENRQLSIPIRDGKIDFEFMESFVSELGARRLDELKAQRLAKLEAYLVATGLKDYNLTDEECRAIDMLNDDIWEQVDVVKLFNVNNTKNILARDIVPGSGETPYLCASAENNSVSSYIDYNEELKDKRNCIFIGGKTFVVSYQEQDFFSNDSHNLALYLKDENKKSKYNQLFLVTCIQKSLTHKYSWDNSISNSKIQKDKITIPMRDENVDYQLMENVISAIQKLVIKDTVDYLEHQISLTENILKTF